MGRVETLLVCAVVGWFILAVGAIKADRGAIIAKEATASSAARAVCEQQVSPMDLFDLARLDMDRCLKAHDPAYPGALALRVLDHCARIDVRDQATKAVCESLRASAANQKALGAQAPADSVGEATPEGRTAG